MRIDSLLSFVKELQTEALSIMPLFSELKTRKSFTL